MFLTHDLQYSCVHLERLLPETIKAESSETTRYVSHEPNKRMDVGAS